MLVGKCKKKAFTIVEAIIAISIVLAVVGVVILVMSRGATNIQKGSFNALAANQCFWIVSTIREDISHSDLGHIIFETDSDNTWQGNSKFEVIIEGGKASYSLEDKGEKKVFVRNFIVSNEHTAYKPHEIPTRKYGDEYLTEMSISKNTDANSNKVFFQINITMKDFNETTVGKREIKWSAIIYPDSPNEKDDYWVSTYDDPS